MEADQYHQQLKVRRGAIGPGLLGSGREEMRWLIRVLVPMYICILVWLPYFITPRSLYENCSACEYLIIYIFLQRASVPSVHGGWRTWP